jgi:hypothetical protein
MRTFIPAYDGSYVDAQSLNNGENRLEVLGRQKCLALPATAPLGLERLP